MNGRHYYFLGLVAMLSVATLLLVTLQRNPEERSETNPPQQELDENPPEDWFVTQRVVHGGIPVGAREKAGAQKAALTLAAEQVATAPWQFVGPTNIGGRVLD